MSVKQLVGGHDTEQRKLRMFQALHFDGAHHLLKLSMFSKWLGSLGIFLSFNLLFAMGEDPIKQIQPPRHGSCRDIILAGNFTYAPMDGGHFIIAPDTSGQRRVVELDSGTPRDDIPVHLLEDKFREGAGASLKNAGGGGRTIVELDGKLQFVFHPTDGLHVFDGSGFEFRVPPELRRVKQEDIAHISSIEGSNYHPSVWIELKDGSAYRVFTRSQDASSRSPDDLFFQSWYKRTDGNEYLHTNNYSISTGQLTRPEEGQAKPGEFTPEEVISNIGVDTGSDLGIHSVINPGPNAQHIFAHETGLYVVNGADLKGSVKVIGHDPAAPIKVETSAMAQVGRHVVILTKSGHIRSFKVDDVVSGAGTIAFEQKFDGIPRAVKPEIDGSEMNSPWIERLSPTDRETFAVRWVDNNGAPQVAWYRIDSDGKVSVR